MRMGVGGREDRIYKNGIYEIVFYGVKSIWFVFFLKYIF